MSGAGDNSNGSSGFSGGKVVDFQHHLVKDLNKKHDELVDYCRANLSGQAQVHRAALSLLRAKGLEQLLEVMAIDFLSIFAADVVRLVVESDLPAEDSDIDQHFSGMVLVKSGGVEEIFATNKAHKSVVVINDINKNLLLKNSLAFSQIFAGCEDLAVSCALMRLPLEVLGKDVMLAIASRHSGHFSPKQEKESFTFLSEVAALQLEKYLDELSL